MQRGTLEGIYVAAQVDAPCEPRASAQVEPGAGLVGDRHGKPGAPTSRQRTLSLIAAETLEDLTRRGLALAPGAHRRQLVTRGVSLEGLVGKRFRIGSVLAEGTGPCEPCEHMESLTRPGVRLALEGRGGITARVLEGGTLRVGDPLVEEPAAEKPAVGKPVARKAQR